MIIVSRNCLVPDCKGADHKWEFERPTLREFKVIQECLGLDPDQFEEALNADLGASIDALLMLLMLLHRRDGIKVAFDDVDADIGDLEFLADPVAEAEADEKPTGPTPPFPLPVEPAPASTSGDSTAAESEPRSSPTGPSSGAATASPSSPSGS